MPVDVAARIERARSFIGTPFRLQGRTRDGLDCVGLIAVIHDLKDVAPDNYGLRGVDRTAAEVLLRRHFKLRFDGAPRPGDVLLLLPGSAQLHLGLWTGSGLVHAHAGLRRVVETPGPLSHPIASFWHQETD